MNTIFLTQAAAITSYVVIGSRLEEWRLAREFGDAYARYRETVPALIPRLWTLFSKRNKE